MPNLSKLFTGKDDAPFIHKNDWSADSSSNGLLSPGGSSRLRRGHRRQLSFSRLRSKKAFCTTAVFVLILLLFALSPVSVDQLRDPYREESPVDRATGDGEIFIGDTDDGGIVPLGQSRERNGREFFWWEQFPL